MDERRTPRRALFADAARGLRVSWHAERDTFVLSLWQVDLCVGTFRMDPEEAQRLADFLAAHAADARAA